MVRMFYLRLLLLLLRLLIFKYLSRQELEIETGQVLFEIRAYDVKKGNVQQESRFSNQ